MAAVGGRVASRIDAPGACAHAGPRATNTIEPLIAMTEQGLGIACLPDFAIRRQLAAGALVPVLAAHTHHAGTFRLLWLSSRYVSPKLRFFVDFMARNLFAAGAAAAPAE